MTAADAPAASALDIPLDDRERALLLKLFDPSFYLDRYPDARASGKDPFIHFLQDGAAAVRSPHPLFDTAFYLSHYPKAADSGLNPALHFLRAGASEGFNPHPLFDTVFYLNQNSDVADSGLNPLIHFIEHGAAEGRNPHPFFDTGAYLAANPDVADSGMNPLIHYVCSGAAEGRPLRARQSRDATVGQPKNAGSHTRATHTGTSMRMEIAKSLSGDGIEFGAGSLETVFPLPAQLKVRYADSNTNTQLSERNYFQGRTLLPIDLYTGMEEMAGIEDESVDFIIASHVIEHTRNPILALRLAFKKLRLNGKLVLVVPDREMTFDKDRPLTTIEHLIADFEMPSKERDFEYYIEFFRRSFPQPDPLASAKGVWEHGDDIHFHTWSYDSFGAFLQYVTSTVAPWREVWSHPRLSDQDIEFFFCLTK